MHPKDINGHTQFLNLKSGALMGNGMTSIRADDEICTKITFALRSHYPNTSDTLLVENKIDHLVLHAEGKRGEGSGFARKKVQKIPLRHERDELAVRRQPREIGHRSEVTIKDSAQLRHFLMRQFQEFIEQAELVHEIEGRRVNGIAAKIPVEIGMLFQHHHI